MQSKTSRHNVKICKVCGKAEGQNWIHHWQVWHPEVIKKDRKALEDDQDPVESWCSNWRDVIDGALPKDVLTQYEKYYRCTNKRHKLGQSEATPSIVGEFAELKNYHVPTQENIKKFLTQMPLNFNQKIPQMQTSNEQTIIHEKDSFEESKEKLDSSGGSYSQQSQEQNETLENLSRQLCMSKGWKDAEQMSTTGAYYRITQLQESRDLFVSVLVQACERFDQIPKGLPHAIAISYDWLSKNDEKIPKIVLTQHQKFFGNYKGHKQGIKQSKFDYYKEMKALFRFCRQIVAPTDWIKFIAEPDLLAGEKAAIVDCATNVKLLFDCKHRYSHEYFDLIDYIIDNARIVGPVVAGFVQFVWFEKVLVDTPWLELFQKYARAENTYPRRKVIQYGGQILGILQQKVSAKLLMDIIEICLKNNYCEDIKQVVKQTKFNNLQEFQMGLQIIKEKKQLKSDYETQKKEWDKQEKTQKELEEQRKLKEEDDFRVQQQEKEKEESEAFQKAVEENFSELVKINQFLKEEQLQTILSFQKELQNIASKIKVKLRPEQIITIGLMLTTQKHTTLFQAATGTGKSLIFGIAGTHIHKTTGKKVMILVPTEFLHAYQAHHYCPEACDIPSRICDPNFPDVFYCSYDRFNKPAFIVPPGTVILVDEFHEFFFQQQLQLHDNKIVSHVQKLLSAEKVIGVSATYRGNNGLDKIASILANFQYIQPTESLKERQLQLEVFGKLAQEEIIEKAIVLVREKVQKQPVIMFCEDPKEMLKLIPEAQIFDEIDVGEQMAILRDLREVEKAIIITKSDWCKGVDFVFKLPQAYIIFAVLPKSNVVLQQDSGRGVRGNFNLPIEGTILTEKAYSNLEQLQAGLLHQEQFEKLYPIDYVQSLNFLIEKQKIVKTSKQIEAFHLAVNALNNGASLQVVHQCFSKVRLPQTTSRPGQQTAHVDCDAISNPKLSEEQKKCATLNSTEQLLGKRKQQEPESATPQVLEEEKYATACLTKHKQHFNQCTNGTKKSKHCDACGTAAVRPQNKYWHCSTCDFTICDGCIKQGKIGALFASSALALGSSTKKQKVAPEEVLPLREQQLQRQEDKSNGEQEGTGQELSAFQDLELKIQGLVSLQPGIEEMEKRLLQELKTKYEGTATNGVEEKTVKTNQTRNTERNEKGKFIPAEGEKIGDLYFKKKGFKSGKQRFECLKCQKKTLSPFEHRCLS